MVLPQSVLRTACSNLQNVSVIFVGFFLPHTYRRTRTDREESRRVKVCSDGIEGYNQVEKEGGAGLGGHVVLGKGNGCPQSPSVRLGPEVCFDLSCTTHCLFRYIVPSQKS